MTNLFSRSERPILEPDSNLSWADGAVFNPGAWYDGETVHMLFRAVPSGYSAIDLYHHTDGELSIGYDDYISYIGYASSSDGVHFDVRSDPFLSPDEPFDRFGAEDPRISRLGETYWITYSALASPAFDMDARVRIGLASTTDFQGVVKHGVVGPDMRDKDAVIFPALIGGRIAMLHRIVPSIQIIYFEDVAQLCRPPESLWTSHLAALDEHVVLRPVEAWEERKIGSGPPPIETEEGWLLIYHGVDRRGIYRAGLALLDLNDPKRVLARTRHPVLEPQLPFEEQGDVDNVVFPEGAVVIDGTLHVYYGAADHVVGHAWAPLSDVLGLLHEERLHA